MSEWVVYVMVADAGETLRHFKIGISSDVDGRLPSVQTGCPTPITSVMCVLVPGGEAARSVEKMMHHRLREYRTSGEWFRFDLAEPQHKAAFNEAARAAMRAFVTLESWKWTVFTVAELRKRAAQMKAEDREARKQRRRVSVGRMAAWGYRFLA